MRRKGIVGVAIALATSTTLLLSACSLSRTTTPADQPSAGGSASSTSSASPASSVPLTGLNADQPSRWKEDPKTWSVTLSWDAPNGFEVDHYQVDRDGRTVSNAVPLTTFTDKDAEPGATYRYSVIAFDDSGAQTRPGVATVKTGVPPVADARLEGPFVMKLHITSQSGLQGGARGGGIIFLFDPSCGSGACNVVWSRKGSGGSGILVRSGASYAGTVHAPFLVQSCQGGAINETLVFRLRVQAGEAFHGEWRAAKLDGSLDESAPAFGCVTAHLSYSFTGFAQH
jgi:hypothetical protein